MSTVDGSAPVSALLVDNADVSVDLRVAFVYDPTTRAYPGSSLMSEGAPTFNEPIAVEGALGGTPGAGARLAGYGDYWFERIHLLPAKKSYAFIISDQHVFVEVYNAYRKDAQTVTDIIETGPTGVTILTPHTTPIVFAPLQSRTYDVLVSVVGPPRADNTIHWDFIGVDEPIFVLTGLRLLPFTIPPDWDRGIDDDVMYATAVNVAYDDTEQRMMLRAVPNRSLSYSAAALDSRESGLLASLLWSWQARSYGVLLWMDGAPLLADVVAGSVDLPVDTTNMTLQVGDTVIVIRDPFTWFASPIIEIHDDALTLDTPLDKDFFGGVTEVIPVILGHVAPSIPFQRPTNASSVAQIKFDLQVVTQ